MDKFSQNVFLTIKFYLLKEIKNYSLFPNPVDKNLHIHLDKVYKEIKIKLVDVTGKTFDNKEFKNKSKVSVDVSRLTGQFVFLISLDGVEQKKTSIIIQ